MGIPFEHMTIDPECPDQAIGKRYAAFKDSIRQAAILGDAERCLQGIWDCWMFMNRFRNCDLGNYFDQELHDYVAQVNPKRFETSHLLRAKNIFRIGYIIPAFIETGGASVPHRFLLEGNDTGIDFKQYVLVSNMTGEPESIITKSAGYQYLHEHVDLEELEVMAPNNSWVEKGRYIEEWLYSRKIDFAVVSVDPASLYALASGPVLISGILCQDSHTFTVGPGFCDFTFLVTRDQLFKYKLNEGAAEQSAKLLLLPLHSQSYIDSAVPISRCELGIPENSVVSATTNIWKNCFGDTDVLLQGIAELVRRHPSYHHLFAGTPRGLDVLDYFLSRNPDVRNNIHYVGIVQNFYRLLKSIDFYVNSFPISGGSDIEAAAVGIPTIELLANRNFNLHEPEFLQSSECVTNSLDEFIRLGERFITDRVYRCELGRYLQGKVCRELDKQRILKERLYGAFTQEFNRRLLRQPVASGLDTERTIQYEKLIGIYRELQDEAWSAEGRKGFLEFCTGRFPEKPFGWIKRYEEVIRMGSRGLFHELNAQVAGTALEIDARIQVMQALCWRTFGDLRQAIIHAERGALLSTYSLLPGEIYAKILAENGESAKAIDFLRRHVCGRDSRECLQSEDIISGISQLDLDKLPIFYDY